MLSVSVIVPVYNKAAALARLLDSVLAQGEDVRIVCVNDGSTDGSGAILDAYAKKHTRITVRHTDNHGVSAARNAGLSLVSTETFTFADADDLLPDGALAALSERMEETGADLAAGVIETEAADGSVVPRTLGDSVLTDPVKIAAMTLDDAFDGCYGKLYRTAAYDGIRFDEDRKVNEDGFFVFECLLRTRNLALTGASVYRYTYDAGSVSRSAFGPKFADILYFGEREKTLLDAKGPGYAWLAEAVLARHRLAYLNKMASCRTGYTDAELRAARRAVVEKSGALICANAKERLRLLLIRFCFLMYLKWMRRGS